MANGPNRRQEGPQKGLWRTVEGLWRTVERLWRTVEGMVEGSEEFIKRHRGRGEDGGLDLVGG